jgi:hypothetical protein
MNSTIKSQLDKIFYGDDFLSRNLDSFYAVVKKSHPSISKSIVKFYYDNQQVVQIFKPYISRKNIKHIPIISDNPFDVVYCDTMFITSINLTIVNFIDLFSKFGYSQSFRGQSISSKKTTDVLYNFVKSVIKLGFYPNTIKCDEGTEFKGEFRKECKELDIQIKYQDPNDKLKTSPIEAFNRTIRLSIEKSKSMMDSNNPITTQVEKALGNIVMAYNNLIHSSTNHSPMDVLTNKEIQDEVAVKNNLKKQDALDLQTKIPIGSYVRIALKNSKAPFQKLTPSWSKEVYKVKEYDSTRNRYILENVDGYFGVWKLQVIDKDNLQIYKTSRYSSINDKADDVRKTYSQKQAQKELFTQDEPQPILSSKRSRKKKEYSDFIEFSDNDT